MLEVLNRVCESKLPVLKLKLEQEKAVTVLLAGKDFFAVLPTGFVTCLISLSNVCFVKAESSPSIVRPTVNVAVPLRSIDQGHSIVLFTVFFTSTI